MCGSPVVSGVRFCVNCGTFLAWPKQRSTHGHFIFIGLAVIGLLIVGGIIAYGLSLQAPVSSTIPSSISQSQSQPLSLPQPLPLATPTALSPGLNNEPGQVVDTITPSLQWNAVSGADYYSLIISKFPYNVDNTVCSSSRLEGTSLIVPDGLLEYGQRYRWTIEAHSETGQSSVSNVLYFETPQPATLSDSTASTVPAASQPSSTQTSPSVSAPPWTPVTLPGCSS